MLHLFKNYYPPTRGGVEQWINGVVHAAVFAEAGITFDVLTASAGSELIDEDDNGVRVVRAPAIVRASTAPFVPAWPSWIRRLEPDVLHVHMPNPTGELAVLLSRTRAPVVATYHADVVRKGPVPVLYERFARRFLKRADRILVGSPALARSTPVLHPHAEKITVVPYGVDPDEWSTRPAEADAIRERFPGRLVVLVGRLVHYKGADVLVEAMRHVDATALVVGDGPMRAGAEELAQRRGVRHKVRFVGEVSDDERLAYMHAADLFVLPSTNRGESYGIVQVQAMATGTPSVCTDVGTGTAWVNRHGETGLVVPPNDPVALARAISELLSDDARRAEMGRAAAERVRAELTEERMLDELRRVYENVAQAR